MRLIDADKLMLSLNDNFLANSPTGNETLAERDHRELICEGLEIAMATVEGAPTIDAAPVVHGYWDDSFDGITPFCSACHMSHRGFDRTPNYCPHCGAQMDLEKTK